jgi:DNA segregation ATPase FtsK/SpoIIIE-like protein
VLGVTVREDGQAEVIRADMGRLVHVAVGGSSGWGKSVFLRILAYQLAKSSDPVGLALIDLEGATFAPFSLCDRLLWPVADTEADALAIFRELAHEMDRRKALYAQHPGVDSLRAYNARAEEPLTPVVILVDEATALLGDKPVENATRTLALRARKYGLWLVLGGQDWKASSLDTAIRNQLSSRIQFRAMSSSQSRVLLQQSGAENLDTPGRALAILPGHPLLELQAPVIAYEDIIVALAGSGPQNPMPTEADVTREELIRILAGEGLSQRQIELQVFGYTGGKAHTEVRRVLGATTVADEPLDCL